MILRILLMLCLALCSTTAWALAGSEKHCVTAGCSGQLCVDASQSHVMSTCEWEGSYGCLHEHSTCELQQDGRCGWTQSEALQACFNQNEQNPILGADEQCTHVCGDICADRQLALIAKFDCTPKPTDNCYPTHSTCTKQKSGICGWSRTDKLNDCLNKE